MTHGLRLRTALRLLVALAGAAPALVGAAGCSSSSASDEHGLASGEALTVASDHGATSATVHADRIAQGNNSFDVEFDPPATIVTGATVFMPVHGHGSEPPTIERTDRGFRIEDVIFSMAGTWDVTLGVEVGETSDQVEFTVDVP
jgi:hypothetical protein